MTSGPDSQRGAAVLEAIRSRRVVRAMTAEPVGREALETLLDAARWAPTAGNRHLQRFVATDDLATLRVLRAVSPGMLQRPTAAITICTDRAAAAGYGFPPGRRVCSSTSGRRWRPCCWPHMPSALEPGR